MRLFYLRVDSAVSCGGLLDGLELSVSRPSDDASLAPLCLIGPNGAGKSQLLQLIAEIFQTAWHTGAKEQERTSSNTESTFEVRYSIAPKGDAERVVRLSRSRTGRTVGPVEMAVQSEEGEWVAVTAKARDFTRNLPSLVVGYTSGDNETLSLPFFVSRSGYARDVREAARPKSDKPMPDVVPDNRLLLIDYSTHLEVLVANLLLAKAKTRTGIIDHAGLEDLASFRCVIQLKHAAAPADGVQLTPELRGYVETFKALATCWHHDPKLDAYTLDFFVNEATRAGFAAHFNTAADLYRAFHKIALLNDLAIPREARLRLQKDIDTRRFASRLPEPQDEDKVFRFEQVAFRRRVNGRAATLDYVSLSDGEHQFAQILGIFSMMEDPDALFILDEPESHFNPQWRVQFTKSLLGLPNGARGRQEVLLTTHAPFVPCDLPREQVLIFKREEGRLTVGPPSIETFGASFDRILDACFRVSPPISQVAHDKMQGLLKEGDAAEIELALTQLGPSVERSFLADRLRQLKQPS
ncbi:hypothetical protein ASG17_00830 [Brevundimonas sp. Leaf363]|uniref:restriction system-associated AAA family ATPase n=1 Tax=Brevundimonas sp. Leaf363 TaxID=1736353 RepID=UPI0006FE3A96|nr:restriction system-associated AAA family ATPase [Brevundimonas sp. Leaf363]KQS57311.1 hypothetical protein ASG17_00830 [Brevundimonas sp. Leaf363]